MATLTTARPMPSHSPTAPDCSDDKAQRLAVVERLYAEHHGFVWRVAARFGIEAHEREDLVQDVFLVVYHALDHYEQRGAMTSWLYGITRGLARNRVRRQERRRRSLHALPPPEPGHTRATDDVEASQILGRFLDSLPPRQRAVFELAEIEGLTGPEIHAATGWKLNTIYSRLRVARQAFDAFTQAYLHEGSHG